MGWLSAIGSVFKTIGLALGMIKREEEKSDDFKIAHEADLEAQAQQVTDAAANRDRNSQLSDAQLDSSLRQDGAGH